MQLVSLVAGCAFESDSMAVPASLSVSRTVPAETELPELDVWLENAEYVAAPLTTAKQPSTSMVRSSFLGTTGLDCARELQRDGLDPARVAALQAAREVGPDAQSTPLARSELERPRPAAKPAEPAADEGGAARGHHDLAGADWVAS